jgi:Fur family ferric uptake transcriptional regulator
MNGTAMTEAFEAFLREQGQSLTTRRRWIVEHLAKRGGHVTLQELTDELQTEDPGLGTVTVYRTMRLLEEAGLMQRTPLDGVDHYEPVSSHHDHMLCEACGRVFEFHSPAIEARQAELAAELGFRITAHEHVLRGRCRACRS